MPEATDTPEPVTITYLEMRDVAALVASAAPPALQVALVDPPDPNVNRRFYIAVGNEWDWSERLSWSDEDWHRYATRPGLSTWLGRLDGEEIGYFELQQQDDGDTQLAYFGLLPSFIGQGLGGALLTLATQQAWAIPGTQRVWLHTCTNDHPSALENYKRRGFCVFKTVADKSG